MLTNIIRHLLPANLALAAPAFPAVTVSAPASTFITLGTMGGPVASPARSQPANALIFGDDTYLIDIGDGAVEQIAS